MTTPISEPAVPQDDEPMAAALDPEIPTDPENTEEDDERRRRILLLLLLLLLVCLCCVGALFARYLMRPQPLPDMIPQVTENLCYPPAYKFSINDIDAPLGVALSPDGERIYVTEGSGERLIKSFDRTGNLLNSFSSPGTDWPNRQPTYIAVNNRGMVFVVNRKNNSIEVYDPDGNFIDAIIAQDMTLSKYLSQNGISKNAVIVNFDGVNMILVYRLPGMDIQQLPVELTDGLQWTPLGIRVDKADNLIYTDATDGKHSVHVIPASAFDNMTDFDPQITGFGSQGSESDQFDFPQAAVLDSKGNYYISDGNNSRVTSWTPDMQYRSFFGFGSGEGSLNLPRGAWMDTHDCLLVADTVGSKIQVYDVSSAEPTFAYSIGDYGISEGFFSFPNDIIIDGTGRLYVTDRENNRVQIWSY